MTKPFLRSLTALILLLVLIVAALPTTASDRHNQLRARGWTLMQPSFSPPPRADTALAYDTDRGRAILFGGYVSGTELDDTFEWDSETLTWVERFPASSKPAARFGHAMVYDPARGLTWLFGGNISGSGYSDETWSWDGVSWTQHFPTNSPSSRWLHRMIYDAVRQKVVLVGGQPEEGWNSDQTWEWDGVNWVERTDIAPFSPRYGFGLAFDPQRDVTVIFAGDDGIGWQFFNDVWERAGDGDWVQIFPPANPQRRQSVSGGYLPRISRSIFYGGYNSSGVRLSDTLAWTGSRWQLPQPLVHPTGNSEDMVYDTVNQGLLLYVGLSADNQYVGETWYLR